MGGDKENTTTTIRYAPYLETAHQDMLALVKHHALTVLTDNPFKNYTELDFDAGFLGGYALSAYPTLYDMFGKFLAGLDIDTLYDELFEDTINGSVITNLIATEGKRMSDDLEQDVLPRFELGMRDVNAVMSSTYLVGRALIESKRVQQLSKFSAEARYRLLPIVTERWREHLGWNKSVIELYAQILKLYISQKMDISGHNYEMLSKGAMWRMNPLQYWIQAVSAMQGATNTTSELAGASKGQKVIGGAMSGAASGAMVGAQFGSVGGPIGAGIGAGVGALIGLL